MKKRENDSFAGFSFDLALKNEDFRFYMAK